MSSRHFISCRWLMALLFAGVMLWSASAVHAADCVPPETFYATWATNTPYAVGARVSALGQRYESVSAHTSQTGWEPFNAPALWRILSTCPGIGAGVPVWTPQAAYAVGNRVWHYGSTYLARQAHTSLIGWEPPNAPALWQLEVPPGTTHRLDVFLLRELAVCAIGDACSGDQDQCFKFYDDNGAVVKAFANNANFRVTRPNDPALATAPQRQCLRLKAHDLDLNHMRQQIEQFRANVGAWTREDVRLNVVVHDVNVPVETSMTTWNLGLWLAPWDARGSLPGLSSHADFVIVSHATRDPDSGLHHDLGGCGGSFGVDLGLSGAGYSWVPTTASSFGFECAEQSVYMHEWLHQVHYGLHHLSGFNDLYRGAYPACGQGHPDPTLWFPDPNECNSDPNYARCGLNNCGTNDEVNAHVLQSHWRAGRRLVTNHCKDGVRNFSETGVDAGGICS
jgi:hypothetical protein